MTLHADNLRKAFGDNIAVDIEHYEARSGELIGLVGNNGAGKTTFFRLMVDLIKADDGQVTYEFGAPGDDAAPVQAIDPSKSEEWKNHVGAYVDEGFLIDFLTPEEYFSFIGRVCGLTQEETDSRVAQYATLMAGEVMGQKKLIRDLSAGNKQKVGIVAVLLNDPELLILDEPFNFLDPTSQIVLKHVLQAYNETHGATVIISSHNLSHTIDICSRITLLEHGRVVQDLANTDHSAEAQLNDYFNQ